MEDDNEILDWGNEDEEHNETLRKPSFDSGQRDTGELDAEDTISLGDEEEDNQEYLSYRSKGTNGHLTNARDITESQLRASTPQKTLLATGANLESQHFSSETTDEKPSTPRKSSSTEDSPRRIRDSRDQTSPQQSQPNHGRLTHALPPKPMTTKVPPYLPPSHPSIVEATSMIISPRAGGRETKKNNGVSSGASIPSTADELPHNWEYREARSGGGRYYYNKETHLSTWEKPVSSVPSTSNHAECRSRRRRSSSTGRRHPPDSNPHQPQTLRPSRNSAHMPPDREMDDAVKAAPPNPTVLSYEDRHYRPSGELSSAAVEIRTTERLSEVVNNRVSSQSRYDRMPPASPPPSRRRARSPSPHESRGSYLHEKEKRYQSSRGNSHSARGQNAYTNDPQRDFETLQHAPDYAEHRSVRSPHLDFSRNDHDQDSSRRRGRRQNDEPMVDEHPDSRNRTSLRRRESSHEPDRDRDPPRPSELREDANQNPIFISAPRRGSTPPHARDRDQHYEPMVRDYRALPGEDPRSAASVRKDRSLHHDGPASTTIGPTININPSDPDFPFSRQRDREIGSLSNFTHPSRRVSEREYDRNRREKQILERDEFSRRLAEYPRPVNQVPERSRHREPSRPHLSDFDRSSPDHVGQTSHRKRAPLPPQATTFLTSSTAPAHARDAPAQSFAAPVAPRKFKLPDFSGLDGNVPLAPRRMIHVNEEPLPRSGATGGAEYDRDRSRNPYKKLDRGPNHYTPLPPINIAMDVDDGSRSSPSHTSHGLTRNGSNQYQEDDVDSPSGSRWPSSHSITGGFARPTASPVLSGISDPENGKPTGRTSSTLAPASPRLPGDNYSEIRDFDRSRQEPSGMKEERMDTYSRPRSKSRGRPAEYPRPTSGTNNIPIGNRRPSTPIMTAHTATSSLPPPIGYNPDAKPLPSMLTNPGKLLPPGKESYERPADLEIVDTPQIRNTNDVSLDNYPRPSHYSESSERALPLAATGPGKPRQRKSRFDKPVTQLKPESIAREPSPISDKGTHVSQSDVSDKRATTLPPLSREPSTTSVERLSSRLSDPGQPSDTRSDRSSMVPSHLITRIDLPVTEQPEQSLLNRFSKDPIHHSLPPAPDLPTSLSHRLTYDRPRHRQRPSDGPMSGRDERSREVELSFHNAHAEFVREQEEGIVFQERLERFQPQRRGASLLDRLSTSNFRSHDSGAQQSLRDRIIPSKRDREDMMGEGMHDVSFDGEDGTTESKRARRKSGRARTRGGRRNGLA